jgi:hypothetical protein
MVIHGPHDQKQIPGHLGDTATVGLDPHLLAQAIVRALKIVGEPTFHSPFIFLLRPPKNVKNAAIRAFVKLTGHPAKVQVSIRFR